MNTKYPCHDDSSYTESTTCSVDDGSSMSPSSASSSGEDNGTDKGSKRREEQESAASSFHDELTAWIVEDAHDIWCNPRMRECFPPSVIRRLRNSFLRSTLARMQTEVQEHKNEPEETLDFYRQYVEQFHLIANAMIEKQRAKLLSEGIQKYARFFAVGQGEDETAESDKNAVAAVVLARIMKTETYGQDLVYHFLRERPDLVLSQSAH